MTGGAFAAELPVVRVVTGVTAAAGRRHVARIRLDVPVTIGAHRPVVAALEREAGHEPVVEDGALPVVRGVAIAALFAQRAAVRVVAMAGSAVGRCIVEAVRFVTSAAGDGGVQPGQREGSEVVIEAYRREPAALRMTAVARGTHLPRVGIVDGVTAAAIGRDFGGACSLVATAAIEIVVRVRQGEAGGGMIEVRVRPGRRLVTTAAVIAVPALVVVIDPVTVDATVVEPVLEVVAAVTVTAFEGMRVGQRKTRFGCVVEPNAAPCGRRMAVVASAAVRAVVHVVDRMTAGALPRRRRKFIVGVAVGAHDVGMAATKRVTGVRMIETGRLPVE